MSLKKTINMKRIGNIFTLCCIVFIIWTISRMDVDWAAILTIKYIGIITIGLAVLSLVQYSIGPLAWSGLLSALSGKKTAFPNIYYVYGKANLAKYLPGNVMHFAGRNLLGESLGVSQADIAMATVFEILCTLLSSFTFTLVLSAPYLLSALRIVVENEKYLHTFMALAAVGLFALAVAFLLIRKNQKVKIYSAKLLEKRILSAIIKAVILYWGAFLLLGLISIILYRNVLGINLDMGTARSVIGLTTSSWLLGYIVPGAPGGIGVREAVSVLLMAPLVGKENVAVASVLLRVVNVMGDVLMYLIGILLYGKYKEKD